MDVLTSGGIILRPFTLVQFLRHRFWFSELLLQLFFRVYALKLCTHEPQIHFKESRKIKQKNNASLHLAGERY